MSKVVGRVFLATILPLLLVETLLQAFTGLYSATSDRSRPRIDGSGRRRIVCVGDSFNFGMGATASDKSYPSVLEKELSRGTDPPFSVVNLGWPGRDSREALAVLAREIGRLDPAVVLILVGTNDRWTRPRRLEIEEAFEEDVGTTGFTWRWRTWRLLKLLCQPRPSTDGSPSLPSDPAPPAVHPLVGAWRGDGFDLVFSADGQVLAGRAPLRWTEENGELRFIDPDDGATVVPWELSEDRLQITLPHLDRKSVLQRRPREERDSSDPVDGAQRRFAGEVRVLRQFNDHEKTARVVEEWMSTIPDDPGAHAAQVEVSVRSGDRQRVDVEISWLRRHAQERDDEAAHQGLSFALFHTGHVEEAFRSSCVAVERFSANLELWIILASSGRLLSRWDDAERAADRILELSSGVPAPLYAYYRVLRAHIVGPCARRICSSRTDIATIAATPRWRPSSPPSWCGPE